MCVRVFDIDECPHEQTQPSLRPNTHKNLILINTNIKNLLSSTVPHQHDTAIKAFLVHSLLGFSQLLFVTLAFDIEFLCCSNSGQVSIVGGLNDGSRREKQVDPFGLDVVICRFFG